MNYFFTQLPVIITQFSLALIKVLIDQLKWMGSIYYHIETAILGTVADISLAILSLRYVFLLLVIGGALGYFGLWWFLAVYMLIILIAVVQFFCSARLPPDPDVEKAHQELRDKSVKFLRIPLRALAMLVSLYFSWQLMDWKSMTPSSFETLAEEKQVVVSSKKETINDVVSSVPLPEKSAKVTTEQPTVSNTFDESQWEKVRETKTCVMGWKTETSTDGWCSLGEFEAGEYRFEVDKPITKVDLDGSIAVIPMEGFPIQDFSTDKIFVTYVQTYYPIKENHIWGLIVKKASGKYVPISQSLILRDAGTLSLSINFMNTVENLAKLQFNGIIKVLILKKKNS